MLPPYCHIRLFSVFQERIEVRMQANPGTQDSNPKGFLTGGGGGATAGRLEAANDGLRGRSGGQ